MSEPARTQTEGEEQGPRFSFVCGRCESTLEALPSQSGRTGRCPSCGVEMIIPEPGVSLGAPVGLVDPSQVAWERFPVHAYASAGEMAPRIVDRPDGSRLIECPQCRRTAGIEAEACPACGRPFTMAGVVPAAPQTGNALAVLSLILGLFALPIAVCGGAIGGVPALVSLGLGLWGWSKTRPGQGSSRPLILIGAILSGLALLGAVWAVAGL
ncbi:MAG: hypothetical protein JSU68_00790 [Phycisphaerales bacterium]|nr:MAG: hypothetical protein JSU68_00790 [Phycisphaerales bacterium]